MVAHLNSRQKVTCSIHVRSMLLYRYYRLKLFSDLWFHAPSLHFVVNWLAEQQEEMCLMSRDNLICFAYSVNGGEMSYLL